MRGQVLFGSSRRSRCKRGHQGAQTVSRALSGDARPQMPPLQVYGSSTPASSPASSMYVSYDEHAQSTSELVCEPLHI